jgi:zinc transporter ZupT
MIGATTTLACFAHEIPHEIADYSILIRSGFTKKRAMQSQFLTAVGAFVSLAFSHAHWNALHVLDRYRCPRPAYHFI